MFVLDVYDAFDDKKDRHHRGLYGLIVNWRLSVVRGQDSNN